MIASKPCACRQERLAYMQNVVVDEAGDSHYASYCPGQRIELKPEPDPSPGWTVLLFTCDHGEARLATGPNPERLAADLGCCEKAEVA